MEIALALYSLLAGGWSLLAIRRAIFHEPSGWRFTMNTDFLSSSIGSPPALGMAVTVQALRKCP
ncbi:MAG: hypothetical protein GTO42_01325 [Candidatus Latescibacteria bacterium]|nr:hypothetical protein [Candidatus Latescibacterota bacterium]NIO27170.1 hypothetical protein [Candidatus Latescibacterota bacterium]NIO54694.1 hypothetical protein [Candidatus Latescibacterota bacterium]NIT00777.1 hypothetical protein [Candidatus Latescibacterota bacterium]NIT37700.1 hypothetical protein [Candidatus Latescibacterota bacterium]